MVVWWVSGTHRNTPSEPKEQQQYMVASLLLIAGLLVAILVALIKIGNKL